MLRRRVHLIIAVGTVLYLLVGSTFGKSMVVHKHSGRGYVMTRPHRPTVAVGPIIRRPTLPVQPYGRIIHERPFFHRIGPDRSHRHLVVIRTPYGQIIKAFPTPKVVTRFGVVEPMIVRVWFTNSDGSRTGVELVRRGSGYVGPRGEWYCDIPMKRQLWIAYGF